MARIIVAISGASGIVLATKTISALAERGHGIELVITPDALYTASLELGREFGTSKKFLQHFSEETQKQIQLHANSDTGCAICSGSYPTDGMVIVPCSMSTIAAMSCGLADNTLRRAADVIFKEKKRLTIVPRETPFSEIHLENMLKLSQRGAMILPPIPAWYSKPTTLDEIENFIVGKILDSFNIPHQLYKRWKIDIG